MCSRTLTLILMLTLWLLPAVLAAELGVKSLSGPPTEFDLHRLPATAEAAVPSSLLLIDRAAIAQGSDAVENPGSSFSTSAGVGFSLVQVSTTYPEFGSAILTSPRGQRYEMRGASITCNYRSCAADQANLLREAFRNRAPAGMSVFSISGGEVEGGTWTLTLQGASGRTEVDSMITFDDNSVEVGIEPEPCVKREGEISACDRGFEWTDGAAPTLSLAAFGKDTDGRRTERQLVPTAVRWTITDNDSGVVRHRQDLASREAASLPRNANDQPLIRLPALATGNYTVRLDVAGTAAGAGPIERTAFLPLPILAQSYRLNHTASAEVMDADRLQIHLEADRPALDGGHVYAYAEVWTGDGEKPLAWIGGMTHPSLGRADRTTLPLVLDARWLALADERGSEFLLRNVRIQDPDTFIPLDQIAELRFSARRLPRASYQAAAEVHQDESLFVGKGDLRIPGEGTGSTLGLRGSDPTGIMLVHGWCSNPIWPVGDFINNGRVGGTGVFSDPGASRSHDGFAQLLRNQGDLRFTTAWSAVAHSQGGAAATHLRAFYTSGLDSITAPRRIQTMGTPYLGSTLMDLYQGTGPIGWIVSEIFGLCGQQFSLTTVGSLLWNASLPGFVRGEVFFHRTRHRRPGNYFERLQFWRWRCNLASFIIPSADDGVVADFQGFLFGGNSQGITDGECHTGGMNHPSQTRNGARNDTMDALGRPAAVALNANCFVQSTFHSGGPTGDGYFEYHVNASNSVPGSFPISTFTWSNGGPPGSPTTNPIYGPLFPGLPGQASSYTVTVVVTDTSGATDSATCIVP